MVFLALRALFLTASIVTRRHPLPTYYAGLPRVCRTHTLSNSYPNPSAMTPWRRDRCGAFVVGGGRCSGGSRMVGRLETRRSERESRKNAEIRYVSVSYALTYLFAASIVTTRHRNPAHPQPHRTTRAWAESTQYSAPTSDWARAPWSTPTKRACEAPGMLDPPRLRPPALPTPR
ncbi:hypothetical protein B0H17DRAFT_648195 [Mycena rosella]|uniref:Secreted protein n=1 Tax=Mycena rosella TaxID=1033263 RepID=A0AAD7BE66_MYCRO|nr:hypothetical protein B0H17DRAFT_648195 [Mycena rosella]